MLGENGMTSGAEAGVEALPTERPQTPTFIMEGRQERRGLGTGTDLSGDERGGLVLLWCDWRRDPWCRHGQPGGWPSVCSMVVCVEKLLLLLLLLLLEGGKKKQTVWKRTYIHLLIVCPHCTRQEQDSDRTLYLKETSPIPLLNDKHNKNDTLRNDNKQFSYNSYNFSYNPQPWSQTSRELEDLFLLSVAVNDSGLFSLLPLFLLTFSVSGSPLLPPVRERLVEKRRKGRLEAVVCVLIEYSQPCWVEDLGERKPGS